MATGPSACKRRVQHVGELGLVRRRQDHEVGHRAQVGQVEHAVVGRAVLADETPAIEAEDDVEVLQRDVHDELVVCTLQERGVDGHDRQAAAERHAGGEADSVLLGDAHIEETVRVLLGEPVKPGAGRHGGCDGHDAVVLCCLADQCGAERLGVRHRAAGAVDLAGLDRERADPVEGVRLVLGVDVARALAS